MTREETKTIIRTMVNTYPNYKPEDLSTTVDIWFSILNEYDFGDITKALKKYITTDTSGFAPSIGQLTNLIAKESDIMPAQEAWSLVHKAIKNAIYRSEEEYAQLPALCQKAVGSAFNLRELAMMDSEVVNSVEQSHFIKAYNIEAQRAHENAQLPESMRTAIEMATPSMIEDKQETIEHYKPKTWDEMKEELRRMFADEDTMRNTEHGDDTDKDCN